MGAMDSYSKMLNTLAGSIGMASLLRRFEELKSSWDIVHDYIGMNIEIIVNQFLHRYSCALSRVEISNTISTYLPPDTELNDVLFLNECLVRADG